MGDICFNCFLDKSCPKKHRDCRNYLNIGGGAELGFYKKSNIPGLWDVDTNLTFPMSLNVSYHGENIIHFNYDKDNQKSLWWVTGFCPGVPGVKPSELTATFTIDFKGHEDIYNAFYEEYYDHPSWEIDNNSAIFTF